MARPLGSRKFFVYQAEDSSLWAILRDESHTEAVNAGNLDYPSTGTPTKYFLPPNIKPRRLIYRGPDGDRISIVALTPTIYTNAYDNIRTLTLNGENYELIAQEPERLKLPSGIDTGLNDGDAT